MIMGLLLCTIGAVKAVDQSALVKPFIGFNLTDVPSFSFSAARAPEKRGREINIAIQ